MTSIRNMYTARFAAPELLLGSDDPTVRPRSKTVETDVYAFGMLVLQAITQLPPWSNLNTIMAVIEQVSQGHHPPRPTANGFVTFSHSWWDVCRHFWSYSPGDRPAMGSVLSLLRHVALSPSEELPIALHALLTGLKICGWKGIRAWLTVLYIFPADAGLSPLLEMALFASGIPLQVVR